MIYFENTLIYIKIICTSHINEQVVTTFTINGHKKFFLKKKLEKLINMEGYKI